MAGPGGKPADAAAGAGVTIGAELIARLRREGAVRLSELKPKALRDVLLPRLLADGFELTAAFVRRPPIEQLRAALAERAVIPERELAGVVRGVSAGELRRVLAAALERGELRRILCDRTALIVSDPRLVLDGARLSALSDAVALLAKRLTAARRKHVGLLASDVEDELSALQRVLGSGAPLRRAPPTDGGADAALERVLAAIDAARDEHTGLSFVPRVVEHLQPELSVSKVHAVLLGAARDELIELRPEGGLARLSPAELSLCPPGPAGTRLSWARRAPGAGAGVAA
jgi:hypothetical protein